jgi:hypothetical protein
MLVVLAALIMRQDVAGPVRSDLIGHAPLWHQERSNCADYPVHACSSAVAVIEQQAIHIEDERPQARGAVSWRFRKVRASGHGDGVPGVYWCRSEL